MLGFGDYKWFLTLLSDLKFCFGCAPIITWPAGWSLCRNIWIVKIKPVWNSLNKRLGMFPSLKTFKAGLDEISLKLQATSLNWRGPNSLLRVWINWTWSVPSNPLYSMINDSEHSDKRKYFQHIKNLEWSSGNMILNLVTLEALVVLTQLVLMCKSNYIIRRISSFGEVLDTLQKNLKWSWNFLNDITLSRMWWQALEGDDGVPISGSVQEMTGCGTLCCDYLTTWWCSLKGCSQCSGTSFPPLMVCWFLSYFWFFMKTWRVLAIQRVQAMEVYLSTLQMWNKYWGQLSAVLNCPSIFYFFFLSIHFFLAWHFCARIPLRVKDLLWLSLLLRGVLPAAVT